jgi:hypothetical protein
MRDKHGKNEKKKKKKKKKKKNIYNCDHLICLHFNLLLC